jgi:hypothetical protein
MTVRTKYTIGKLARERHSIRVIERRKAMRRVDATSIVCAAFDPT